MDIKIITMPNDSTVIINSTLEIDFNTSRLLDTGPLIIISLNNISVYCYTKHSSKPLNKVDLSSPLGPSSSKIGLR